MKKVIMSIFICTYMVITAAAQKSAVGNFMDTEKFLRAPKSATANSNIFPITVANYSRTPQVVKNSYWSLGLWDWVGTRQKNYSFINGKLEEEITLDYDGIDTFDRITYSYHFDNKIKSVFKERRGPGISWIPESLTTIIRSGINIKTTIETSSTYGVDSAKWLPITKITTKIDDRGNIRFYTYETYDAKLKMWQIQNGYKWHYTYFSTTEKAVLYIDSLYLSNVDGWIPNAKIEYVYSSNGQLETATASYYKEARYIPYWKQTLTYNAGELAPKEVLVHRYDTTNMRYDINHKAYNLVYSNFNNSINFYENELIHSVIAWPNINGDLEDATRTSKIRTDINGSFIEFKETFNPIAAQWDSSSRITMIYDDKSNLIRKAYEDHRGTWRLVDDYRYALTYNLEGDLVESISSYYDPLGFYYNSEKIEYSNYTNVLSGIGSNTNTLEAIVYPNPSADGNVYVKLTALAQGEIHCKVYTTNGRLVHSKTYEAIVGINTLGIPTLQAGFYIIKLESAEGVAQYKLNVQ